MKVQLFVAVKMRKTLSFVIKVFFVFRLSLVGTFLGLLIGLSPSIWQGNNTSNILYNCKLDILHVCVISKL